jgi:hypothetical protein
MLALLEHSSVTNKGTTVETNEYSMSCSLYYIIYYATFRVCTVNGVTVCRYITKKKVANILSNIFNFKKLTQIMQ